MKLKKLDSEHILLQFLMLLFALIAFSLFTFFTNSKEFWVDGMENTFYILSMAIMLLTGTILLFRGITKKEKDSIYWGVGLTLVGILQIVSLKVTSIGSSIYLGSRILLSVIFFLHWILKEKKRDQKVNKKEEVAKRVLLVFVMLLFFFFLFFFSWKSIFVRGFSVFIFSGIVLMLLSMSLVGNMFLKEWKYKDFSFWVIFSLIFLIVSEIFFFPILNKNLLDLSNLSLLSRLFGQIGFLVGVLNNIYKERLNEKTSKNKKVSKKI